MNDGYVMEKLLRDIDQFKLAFNEEVTKVDNFVK